MPSSPAAAKTVAECGAQATSPTGQPRSNVITACAMRRTQRDPLTVQGEKADRHGCHLQKGCALYYKAQRGTWLHHRALGGTPLQCRAQRGIALHNGG